MKFTNDLRERMKDKLADKLTNFLIIQKAPNNQVYINSYLSEKDNIIKNIIWGRGQNLEIEAMHQSLQHFPNSFWCQKSSTNFMKMHSGVPALMASTLANITVNDFEGVEINDKELDSLWKDIEDENQFFKELYNVVNQTLIQGDSCIKINYNPSISNLPVLECVDSLNVEYVYKSKRLKEIIFKDFYKCNDKDYTLLSTYGKGYITYKLFNSNKIQVPLNTIEELANLQDIYFLDENGAINKNVCLAIPCKFWNSQLFPERGRSIYENKDSAFNWLDQIISSWYDAVKLGRIKNYIPNSMIPKDANGNIISQNDYINSYIKLDMPGLMSENATPKIETVEGQIQVEKYLQSYKTAMNLCIDGIISPSTLGLDESTIQTATEVSEREKITLYSVQTIQDNLTKILKDLIYNVLVSYNLIINNKLIDIDLEDITVRFGQYQSPSFEKNIETIQKVVGGRQFISWELIVEELWGSDLSDEEKALEVQRLKELNDMGTTDPNTFFTENVPATGEEDNNDENLEEEAF